MKVVGANPQAKVSGLEELPGKSNYLIRNDPKKWRTNVSNYFFIDIVIKRMVYQRPVGSSSSVATGEELSPGTRMGSLTCWPGLNAHAVLRGLTQVLTHQN